VSADVDERPAGEAGNTDNPDRADEAGKVADARSRGVRRFWPLAVLVIALVVAAAGLFSWSRAAHDDSIALAKTRDAVLIAATSHIQTLNSLDYRHVDAGLATWAAVTTGTLHDQVTQVSADERKLLADQKKISTGKVVDAAVFSLDGDSATVIASVEVTVQDDTQTDAAPTVKRNRFSADLVDVHGKWLVENLQQVAVDIS
jgi:Mce-associated membrane protein